MKYFHYPHPINPHRIQQNFKKNLTRHHVIVESTAFNSLFDNLKKMYNVEDSSLACPFPLVNSVATARRHASRIKKALGGKSGPTLGKCQMILASFYNYGKWDFFTEALEQFKIENIPSLKVPHITNHRKHESATTMEGKMGTSGMKMRNVFMWPMNARFAPRLDVIKKFLPDVVKIIIEFVKPAPDDISFTDLTEKVTFQFSNGKKLSIDGVFFWKFMDSIPSGLGDMKDQTWNVLNPFSNDSCEELMQRLRIVYVQLFQKNEDLNAVTPLKATIDIQNDIIDVVYPESLSKPLKERIYDIAETNLLPIAVKKARFYLAKILEESISGPIHKLEMKKLSGGFLKNERVTYNRPPSDRNKMVDDLLNEFAPPDEIIPWSRTNYQVFKEKCDQLARDCFADLLALLKRKDTHLLRDIGKSLGFKVTKDYVYDVTKAVDALYLSKDSGLFLYMILGEMRGDFKKLTVDQFISRYSK